MGWKTLMSCVRITAVACFCVSVCSPARAVSISYSASNEAADKWVYSYTLANDSLAAGLSQFRIFFALGEFEDLEILGSPADWDSIVADPDPGLPDDGFFDSLLINGVLALGQSATGFKVRFSWLGVGAPGSQQFVVLDPNTFEPLLSGKTTPEGGGPPPPSVPEPGTLGLISIAVCMLGLQMRRRRLLTSH